MADIQTFTSISLPPRPPTSAYSRAQLDQIVVQFQWTAVRLWKATREHLAALAAVGVPPPATSASTSTSTTNPTATPSTDGATAAAAARRRELNADFASQIHDILFFPNPEPGF